MNLVDALLCLFGISNDLRKWKRLQRALQACYPGLDVVVVVRGAK
jgi:hypothetical protein